MSLFYELQAKLWAHWKKYVQNWSLVPRSVNCVSRDPLECQLKSSESPHGNYIDPANHFSIYSNWFWFKFSVFKFTVKHLAVKVPKPGITSKWEYTNALLTCTHHLRSSSKSLPFHWNQVSMLKSPLPNKL